MEMEEAGNKLASFFVLPESNQKENIDCFERPSALRGNVAREPDGGGAGIGIDDHFEAIFENRELDQVTAIGLGFKGVEAGLTGRRLNFLRVLIGHSGKFGEAARRPTGSSGEARVSVEMQRDAFRVSGHWCPRERRHRLPGSPGRSTNRPCRAARLPCLCRWCSTFRRCTDTPACRIARKGFAKPP